MDGKPGSASAAPPARARRPGPGRAGSARGLALEILQRVEKTEAYANLLLDARLRSGGLSAADRALATELVYGVLRWQGRLDHILRTVLDRPVMVLDPPVRHILRLGAYQLCCLDRIPDFAVVDEAVGLARRARAARSAGYVNAVLRRLARQPAPPADPGADPLGYWSGPGSYPRWLAARWIARLGADEAGRLMAAGNQAPPTTVIVNRLKAEIGVAEGALRAAVPDLQAGRFVPGVFRLRGAGAVDSLPGFSEGWLIPMDEASALPVLALRLAEGQRVLDACAGGGGKSALMAGAVGAAGEVLALDQSPRAVRRLEAACRRLGLERVQARLQDARTAGAAWPRGFARVLLDAPCTGLGTIRRRPEIKWRRRAEDLPRAARLQAELLEGVAGAVAEGGLLAYSTCSLEPEETDAVIGGFLRAHPEFGLEDAAAAVPCGADLVGPDGFVRAWPQRHGTDGFFVACLRREV